MPCAMAGSLTTVLRYAAFSLDLHAVWSRYVSTYEDEEEEEEAEGEEPEREGREAEG